MTFGLYPLLFIALDSSAFLFGFGLLLLIFIIICQTPSPTAFTKITTSAANRQDAIVYFTVTLAVPLCVPNPHMQKFCYELIENMTAHYNYWDSSAERNEPIRSTTTLNSSSSNPEVAVLTKKVDDLSTAMLRMYQMMPNQTKDTQVNMVNVVCETCGGPHPYYDCPTTGFLAQENVYAVNMGGNGYPPLQGDRNLLSYRSSHFQGPPGFNQPLDLLTNKE
jgi:hypothetical protein